MTSVVPAKEPRGAGGLDHPPELERIEGVCRRRAELLGAAGVTTVRELARRNATHLAARLGMTNEVRRVLSVPPSQRAVREWIDHAKRLERAGTH